MIVKVCGLSDMDSIQQISELSPSIMGFIFYQLSPRNACTLNPDAVKSIPPGIERAGVFVNSNIEQILNTVDKYSLTAVQLHGEESPELCRQLRSGNLKVLKAFGLGEDFNFERLIKYEGATDYFVFDTASASYGGSGKKFDWNILQDYSLSTPYLLSGGIGPEDSTAIREAYAALPHMDGVDINSRFEISPGKKSAELVSTFLKSIIK